MEKSKLIKSILVLVISVMLVLFSTSVFAADNNAIDLTNTLTSPNSTNNATSNNALTSNNTNANSNKANNTNTNTNRNNSSIYNNTNLPKTGIESSLPIAALVVVFGISAVYAYKKIKEYKNI